MSLHRPDRFERSGPLLGLLGVGLVGAFFAVIVLGLSELAARWIVWAGLGIAGGAVFLVVRDKERLLFTAFVLSLQVDISLRVLYGYAGGDGLAFPLVFLVGVALVGWRLLTRGSSAWRELRWVGALAPAIAAMFATTVLSAAFTSEQFVGLTRVLFELQLYAVYWVALNTVRTDEETKTFVRLLFVILAVQCLVYGLQSVLGVTFTLTGEVRSAGEIPRPGGTISTNPAGFASAIIPILLIAVAMFVSRSGVKRNRALPWLILLGFGAIGLSVTRAAWVGLALGCLVVIVLCWRRRILRKEIILPLVIVSILVLALAAPMMLARERSFSAKDSFDERWGLMAIAMNVIRAHPIVGSGPGSYAHIYKGFLGEHGDQWLYEVHNEFLLRAAETGIPGGLAFVYLMLAAVVVARRLSWAPEVTTRLVAVAWCGGLLALAWQMFWVPWRGFTYNALLWIMFGVMDARYARRDDRTTP